MTGGGRDADGGGVTGGGLDQNAGGCGGDGRGGEGRRRGAEEGGKTL